MLLGILGAKRSGKDTVADILVKDYGFSKYAFADPIKEICKEIFYWDDKYINGEDKELRDSQWGLSPREAMQTIGTELFQFELGKCLPEFSYINGRLIWAKRFKYWYENINDNENVVVSDVRFEHENTLLKSLGAKILKIHRDIKKDMSSSIHLSESSINSLDFDYLIDNNKSLNNLAIKTHQLIEHTLLKKNLF